jgi:hypothetical protein
MKITTEIEDYEILSTGTIISVADKLIIFKIEDLLFEFEFKNNTEFSENKISAQNSENGKTMRLLFENFNNSLGTGNVEPIDIGYIGRKKIFLNYRIYAISGNSGKLVHYTWLLSKKEGENDGK